ncbi:hypothetical protein ABPG77_008821 [Micractinium sp. CCAP 211/92]
MHSISAARHQVPPTKRATPQTAQHGAPVRFSSSLHRSDAKMHKSGDCVAVKAIAFGTGYTVRYTLCWDETHSEHRPSGYQEARVVALEAQLQQLRGLVQPLVSKTAYLEGRLEVQSMVVNQLLGWTLEQACLQRSTGKAISSASAPSPK